MLRSRALLNTFKYPSFLARFQSTAEQKAETPPKPEVVSEHFQQRCSYLRKAFADLYPDTAKGDLDFSSCDYLDLAHHQKLNRLDGDSIIKHGRITFNRSGCYIRPPNSALYRLEAELNDHLGGYQTCYVNSCTEANMAVFQSILQGRPELPIYLDKYSHATMGLGANAVGRNDMLYFAHNDMSSLKKLIETHGPGLVGIDSIYSAYGTVASIPEIVDICKSNNCILLVDESHSYGICGDEGEGIVKQLGLEKDVDIRTFSCGKAMGAGGGGITISESVGDQIENIRKGSMMSIFSLAPQDGIAERLLESLKIIREEKWRRDDLNAKVKYFRESCFDLGYKGCFVKGETPIISFVIGPVDEAMKMYWDFVERKIFPSPHVYPASPRNKTSVRFSMCQGLSFENIDYTLSVFKDLREKYDPSSWVDAQGINLF